MLSEVIEPKLKSKISSVLISIFIPLNKVSIVFPVYLRTWPKSWAIFAISEHSRRACLWLLWTGSCYKYIAGYAKLKFKGYYNCPELTGCKKWLEYAPSSLVKLQFKTCIIQTPSPFILFKRVSYISWLQLSGLSIL